METQPLVLHFDTLRAAEASLATIRTLDAEGFLDVGDVVLLTRSGDGSVHVEAAPHGHRTGGAVAGGIVGAIVGGLAGMPVVGAAVGSGAAGRRVFRQGEALDELLFSVGLRMESGTAAIAVDILAVPDPDVVRDRLQLLRTTVRSVEMPAPLRALLDIPTKPADGGPVARPTGD